MKKWPLTDAFFRCLSSFSLFERILFVWNLVPELIKYIAIHDLSLRLPDVFLLLKPLITFKSCAQNLKSG
jgi:hypothetical protein